METLSRHSRFTTETQFIRNYITEFLKWMGEFVQIPDSGDYFDILSDLKNICLLIIRVCPAQALVREETLEQPNVDIRAQYFNICKRLDIPVDYRLKSEIFIYRDTHTLFNCLQALVSSIILYVDPDSVHLPRMLITHLTEGSTISSYQEEPKVYTKPVETNTHYSVSSYANDVVSISGVSLDSDGRTSVSTSVPNYDYSGIPGMGEPIFTSTQSQNQSRRQNDFLKELEEDRRIEKELTVCPQEQEIFSSNQLGSPRDSSSYRSATTLETRNMKNNDAIAEEVIEPRDKYQENQTKKKNFWKKVAAVGATVGVIAGTVLAVAAATNSRKNGDDSD